MLSDTTTPLARPTARPDATVIGRPLRVLAWLSFLAEVIIIGTGGAVRLTGSGLGCSEWPLCTPDSLVPTPELGIHGIIEFGNRTMTGLVGVLAIAVLLLTLAAIGGKRAVKPALRFALGGLVAGGVSYVVALLAGVPAFPFFSLGLLVVVVVAAVYSLRQLTTRRDLNALAWIVLIGVISQAFVGGITVLTGLNPFIVGFHYAASLILVCVTAAFVVRMNATEGPRELTVPTWFKRLIHLTGLVLAITITVGVLTTANGPHSGDANVIREGFDATILAHVHSWPGYVLAVLLVGSTFVAWVRGFDVRRWLFVVTVAVAAQVLVGVWQARHGLPPVLVGVHMVFAALSAAAYTVTVLRLKRPRPASDATVVSAGSRDEDQLSTT